MGQWTCRSTHCYFYAPAALPLREESPLLTTYEAGWGPIAGMDGLEKRTMSALAGN